VECTGTGAPDEAAPPVAAPAGEVTTTVLQVEEHWEPMLCWELGESVAVEESFAAVPMEFR